MIRIIDAPKEYSKNFSRNSTRCRTSGSFKCSNRSFGNHLHWANLLLPRSITSHKMRDALRYLISNGWSCNKCCFNLCYEKFIACEFETLLCDTNKKNKKKISGVLWHALHITRSIPAKIRKHQRPFKQKRI